MAGCLEPELFVVNDGECCLEPAFAGRFGNGMSRLSGIAPWRADGRIEDTADTLPLKQIGSVLRRAY